MHAFLAGFGLELRIIRAAPDAFIPLVTAPFFALIFLSIVRESGRPDLQADALMAPVLMTLWWIALQHAGNLITGDRWQALLEPLIATPASLASVLLGRITALMGFGLISFFEVWAIGELVYGVSIPFEHPGALALTFLVTAFATAGTSVAFAAVFVMSRNAYTFTNSLSYPLYLLGGVLVPVAILPGWIQPVSSGIFMSWAADLLRASLKAPPIDDLWQRLGTVALLGAVSFVLGRLILFHVMQRMRAKGELAAT
jgi:ABC-2 type transport system permease protein